MANDIETTIDLLCSTHKLDRDKGVYNFERFLGTMSLGSEDALRRFLVIDLMPQIAEPACCWGKKHGCLFALKGLIDCGSTCEPGFYEQIEDLAINLLNDSEPRVRLAAGLLLGALCRKIGPAVYYNSKPVLITSITENMKRVAGDDPSKREMFETVLLMDKLMSGPSLKKRYTPDPSQSPYDLSGWQHLETSLKNLQVIIEGLGKHFSFGQHDDIVLTIFKTLTHLNRYVRETGFYVLSTLLKVDSENDNAPNSIMDIEEKMCDLLALGLSDNWSQVKLSASIATREFFLSHKINRNKHFPLLLPRMCLNRYYAADGVRIYSQETWRQVTGCDGKLLVEKYIEPTVKYYCEASKSNNSAVREAACSCAAELATKISLTAVKPFAAILIMALLDCCQDISWPVRDAASSACGSLIVNFPDESKSLECSLHPTFQLNLGDSVASVRQSAASALANVIRAFGDSSLNKVFIYIDSGLKGVSSQTVQGNIELNKNECGKRIREMECAIDAYPSTQTTQLNRNAQPWEIADGCVYLLGELACIKEAQELVLSRLPLLNDAGRHKHYPQHLILLDTICKQLPMMAKNIGKRVFSAVVEDFFDLLFYALESGNGLTSSSASQCIGQLSTFLGQNVVRAKISSYNPRYVAAFESVIFTAPF